MRRSICFLTIFSLSTVLFSEDPKPDTATPNPSAVAAEVERYLAEIGPQLKRGEELYYAAEALREALLAFKEKNYGIGSITILKWKGMIYEFRGRNAMVSGYGLRDHAEARALERAVAHFAKLRGKIVKEVEDEDLDDVKPDADYAVQTPYCKSLPDGLHVYGTLEPCPMCMVMMLNAGVKRSISLAKDGELQPLNGRIVSNGAALATDDKFTGAPAVWQYIRNRQRLHFELYYGDSRLADLGLRIFLETRQEIDDWLAQQGGESP